MDKKDLNGKLEVLLGRTEELYSLIHEMQALINVCEQAGYSQVEVGEGEKWDGVFGIIERLVNTAEKKLDQIDVVICEMKRSTAI